MLATVLLFTYDRLDHTTKTISALQGNVLAKETDLIIFSDGFKGENDQERVLELRKHLKTIDGFKSVYVRMAESNKGLAKSIVDGVNSVLNDYSKVIVLEDDLITTPDFLTYMNDGLDWYSDDNRIWSISGYTPELGLNDLKEDVYLSLRASSWGWATWKNRWDLIDWDIKDFEKINSNKYIQEEFNRGGGDLFISLKKQIKFGGNSWAIKWVYNQFINGTYTVYPKHSKIENIGMDNSGIHGFKGESKRWETKLSEDAVLFPKTLKVDHEILRKFREKYNLTFRSYMGYLLKKVGIFHFVKKHIG